jgi:hypothetical protein
MRARELTLGRALAYLEAERTNGKSFDAQGLAPAEKSYLNVLRERVQTMRSHDSVDEVLQALPEQCCRTETPYLAANDDFFLACFIFPCQSDGGDGSDGGERLFKHLNDCFRCFEEFCLVMLEYYHQSQGLGLSQNS